jgi:hypothetical protein
MKAIKIIWLASVFVILFFNIAFDGFRTFDYLFDNYSKKEMTVTKYSFDSSSRRKSITIEGVVDKNKVYFSRFDKDIDSLYNLYPAIFSKEKKETIIKVLKFQHSNIVMLLDDEFNHWKTRLFFSGIYCLISIIIFIYIKK